MLQDDTAKQIKAILKSGEIPLIIIIVSFAFVLVAFSCSEIMKVHGDDSKTCKGSSFILSEVRPTVICGYNANPEIIKENNTTIILCKCPDDEGNIQTIKRKDNGKVKK